MRLVWLSVLLLCGMLLGCHGAKDAVRAAEPHWQEFALLRSKMVHLLERRAFEQRHRAVADALKSNDEIPDPRLRAVVQRLREEGTTVEADERTGSHEWFTDLLASTLAEHPSVLQAMFTVVEPDRSQAVYHYPNGEFLPIIEKWTGPQMPRTFVGTAECTTHGKTERCVIIQLRSRKAPGSAGLTVAFGRAP